MKNTIFVDDLTGATLLVVRSKTHGTFVVRVDADDAVRISQHTWHLSVDRNGLYFLSHQKGPEGTLKSVKLHRLIKQCPDNLQVDHAGGYLDLRKQSLRCATNAENGRNRQKHRHGVSRFKGVTWNRNHRCWIAQLMHNYQRHYLGSFPGTPEGEIMAACAYDAKAKDLFGEFALVNFPESA
ncbi:MAG TPA: hypothetical protein VGR47_03960 [Terracidiphilus sp.]|nr:hypothetical protein [Terracidiphilus sp.]